MTKERKCEFPDCRQVSCLDGLFGHLFVLTHYDIQHPKGSVFPPPVTTDCSSGIFDSAQAGEVLAPHMSGGLVLPVRVELARTKETRPYQHFRS